MGDNFKITKRYPWPQIDHESRGARETQGDGNGKIFF